MRNKFFALLLILLIPLLVFGCSDDTHKSITEDNSVNEGDNVIENNASVAFVGKVVDISGNPMTGVAVQLLADTTYTSTTDANGNWTINVDLGKIVAVGGGGTAGDNWGGSDDDLGTDPDVITRNFPIEYTATGFGTFRQEADVDLTVGYTDGSGAVVLLSKTGTIQPTVVLHPYVDNFTFKVYAGDQPAVGALVVLRSNFEFTNDPNANSGSANGDRYEKDSAAFIVDANGEVTVTAAAQLPASTSYVAIGTPYDMNGDGMFEYNTTMTLTSTMFSSFVLDITSTNSMLHYQLDTTTGLPVMTQTEIAPTLVYQDQSSDLDVVFCSIDNVTNLPIAQAEDFSITVIFNRPVTEELLAGLGGPLFRMTGNGVNIPLTWTSTGNYMYEVTPATTLTAALNTYWFYAANGITASGESSGLWYSQSFNIYNPDATMFSAITPGVDINQYTTYKVDWDEILIGDKNATNPIGSDTMNAYNMQVSFAKNADADNYQLWVQSNGLPWQQIGFSYEYNDGQFIEISFSLNSLYDTWEDTGFIEPFGLSNVFRAIIMPENENGFAQDPNLIDAADSTFIPLKLADNWGPEVALFWGFDGDATDFNTGTYYDDMAVQIAVDEPLSDATLVAQYGAGQYGAKATTGSNFIVTKAYWADNDLADPDTDAAYPSNRKIIMVDLAPAITTTLAADAAMNDTVIAVASQSNFALGDRLSIGDGYYTLVAFTSNGFTLNTGLAAAASSGDTVACANTMDGGYASVDGTLSNATNVLDSYLILADVTGITAGASVITAPDLGAVTYVDSTTGTIGVATAPTAALAAGDTISGYEVPVAGTGVATAAAPDAIAGTNTIVVNDNTPFAVGDLIAFYVGTTPAIQFIEVTSVNADGITLLVDGVLNADLPAGNEVFIIDPATIFTTTLAAGYPNVLLPSAYKIKPGSTITFTDGVETSSATVTEAYITGGIFGYSNVVVLDDVLVDSTNAPYAFAAGSTFTNDSTRQPDSLQVNLMDRSGNDSNATDADGDAVADFDQIGFELQGDTSVSIF